MLIPYMGIGIEWTIYCHTHIASGRRYIGLTKHTMLKRWNRHVYSAMRSLKTGCSHFGNAIKKYGPNAFSHEVLEICHDLEVANMAEECWIELYDTRNPERGFNLIRGGSHTPHPVKNPWERPGFREVIIPKIKAAVNTPENRARISAQMMAKPAEQRSSASKKAWSRPEMRTSVSSSLKSYNQTSEGQAAIKLRVEASQRVGKSFEQRASISLFMKTRPVKDESCKKISASLKGRKIGFAIGNGFQKPPEKKIHCKYGHSLHDAYIIPTVCRGYKYNIRSCRVCAYFKRKPERRVVLEVMAS